MATVNKDFKIKQGLVVEGANATVNGNQVLTETASDQYIINLIGGETLITSVKSDDFTVTGGELTIAAGSDIARDGDITSAINALTTSDIEEGNQNLYHTDTRAKDAVAGALGEGIEYESGSFNVQIATGLVLGGGTGNEIEIDRTTVDTWYDASGSAATAESNANSYTDGRETAITTAYQAYADTAESDAVTTANAYTDGRETAITTAYQAYADTAEQDAKDYADTAIANLVDSAPATLDTLNELAAALQDNPDIISDLQDIAAGKQDTLTAGSNIDIAGATISVTGLDTEDVAEAPAGPLYFTDARAVDAVTGLNNSSYYTLASKDGKAGVYKADVAQTIASAQGSGITQSVINSDAIEIDRSVVDGWYDANGAAATAEANAIAHADALTTADVAEDEALGGLYFTDARARAAAVQLLTTSPTSTSNITITENQFGWLDITAENGVADSTTSDLAEGSNLYFTDARAVSALEAVVPNFTAVEINSVAKQVAATTTVANASQVTAISFDSYSYRSAEFLVKTVSGDHSEISKVLLTLDINNNIAITEYGTVGTNGSLMTVTADVDVTDLVRLRVTTLNNASVVLVTGTLLA